MVDTDGYYDNYHGGATRNFSGQGTFIGIRIPQ